MAGIEISHAQLDKLIAKVRRASTDDMRELLSVVGGQQEDAAKRRITETKKTPGGTAWKPWSRDYAKTRGPQHELLKNEGDLADSMTHQPEVGSAAVLVGSTMIYAGVHLFGYKTIPARAYLDTDGSFADPDDRGEIRELVETWLEEVLS